MLREIHPVRQIAGQPRRRWFSSRRCDLIVWLREEEDAAGFQLCYGKGDVEHAVTWLADRGTSHMRVDGDGSGFGHKGTPLLVPNGAFDAEAVLRIFDCESRDVPVEYVALVARELRGLGRDR